MSSQPSTINSQPFQKHFDTLAETPDAVGKLRTLVLELATRGSLVPQEPNDEPASEILRRIEQKQRKKHNDTPEALRKEFLLVLPTGWALARNRTLFTLRKGKIPKTLFTENTGLPYLDIAALEKGLFRRFTDDLNCPQVDENSLVIVCDGSRSGLVLEGKRGVLGSTISAIDFTELDKNFLKVLLQAAYEQLNANKKGAAIPHLDSAALLESVSAIPPLGEQRRIVAKVEELLALCDELEARQTAAREHRTRLVRSGLDRLTTIKTEPEFRQHATFVLKTFPELTASAEDIPTLRKSILTIAVQGKLVPHDSNDGDARDAIDRAMEKRQRTIQSKNLRRKRLNESDELVCEQELPPSWCIERLANLVDPQNTISYGVLVPGSDVTSGIPFVRVQDLSINNPATLPNKTIAPEIERPYARTRLRGGELLLCVVGATIGRLGVAPFSWSGANIARAVARISPIAEVNRDYLLLVLRGSPVQTYFATMSRTLAQPTLNVGAVEQTPIPLPPLAEQQRIVAKVDELMRWCDALEARLTAAQTTAATLLDATLHQILTDKQ